MGYDLHITKAEFWYDSPKKPITREDWSEYVEKDSEIIPDPDNGSDYFLYQISATEDCPLCWYEGEISTKNPEEKVVLKLCDIAKSLNARVIGDDGELYCTEETTFYSLDGTSPSRKNEMSIWQRIRAWLS